MTTKKFLQILKERILMKKKLGIEDQKQRRVEQKTTANFKQFTKYLYILHN